MSDARPSRLLAVWIVVREFVRAHRRRLRYTPPPPVRFVVGYLLRAARYEPLVAFGLAIGALVVLCFAGFALFMAVAVQKIYLFSPIYVAFGAFLGLGCSAFLTFPLIWPRLWLPMRVMAPHGYEDSYVCPDVKGQYPRHYFRGRTLAILDASRWGKEQYDYVVAAGFADGIMPMPNRRRVGIISDIDVANHANQHDLLEMTAIPKLNFEKPLQMAALFGIIAVALFVAFAIYDGNQQAAIDAAATVVGGG